MEAYAAEYHPQPYWVECPSCARTYDAVAAKTCQCLTSVPSPCCLHCGACLCGQPREALRAFWSGAPAALWGRRLESRWKREIGARQREQSATRRPLILVADDDATTARVARRILEEMGYGVLTAKDGAEALDLSRRFRPDMVLTDVMMPRLDGRKVSLLIKSDPLLASIKVVLMTGLYTRTQYKNEAMSEFLCDGYLLKPVYPRDLQETVRNLLPGSKELGFAMIPGP